jgi:hypothetical protein
VSDLYRIEKGEQFSTGNYRGPVEVYKRDDKEPVLSFQGFPSVDERQVRVVEEMVRICNFHEKMLGLLRIAEAHIDWDRQGLNCEHELVRAVIRECEEGER